MKYGRQASLAYAPMSRSSRKLQHKLSNVKAQTKTVAKTVFNIQVANVMDITNFLAKYLSGSQNVVVAPFKMPSAGFSVEPKKLRSGRQIWQVNVPHWEHFTLPAKGFDKYRIYREGIWHEACHIKFTPRELYFDMTQAGGVKRDLVNIIEDRRIEDLGVKEWPGYLPERLYTQAYAYALRPSVDTINDQQHRLLEAFLQRLLIGKYKGDLPKSEADLIEKASKKVEEDLKEIENEKNALKIEEVVAGLAEYVKKELGLTIDVTHKFSFTESPWEDTFSPEYAANQDVDPKDVEKGIEEFFKGKEKEAKAKERKEGETKPTEVTKEDIEQARQGSAHVKSEYEKIQRKEHVDPDLIMWQPVASQASISDYRDAKFIQAMNTYLQSWREGYVRLVGKSGASFNVKEYIRHKDKPFVTKLKQTVKGKKLLILADFSGSMADRESDYKKALISSLEVLNSVGCNLAMFVFGEDPALGCGYYRIKTFEEPKLTNTHLAKLAALEADYPSTPTHNTYHALKSYIARTRPEVTVTITDGKPDNSMETADLVSRLKTVTRMVAFGIASKPDETERRRMENTLKSFGYHKVFAVNQVHEIPPKLVNLLIT